MEVRGASRCLSRIAGIVILGIVFTARAHGQVDEYRVKAAFLYNFARFIEWPANTFRGPGDPIVICILGQSPFGAALDEAIRGKTLDGRSFAIQLVNDLPPKSSCQILFVNSSSRKHFRAIVGSIRGVLTVGDDAGFIDDGGVIKFKVEGGRIRFEINVEAAEKARLKISSKLLSLAQIVGK